jgi:NAD(P)-dependent dehydrogenase (short-subunit alcohol dehydrogenase family)
MRPRRDLAGKVVLITGAGNGIGAETARQLAKKGALLALVDRDEQAVIRLAAELGSDAEAFVADVADTASVDAAVAAVVERFGGIDTVVANAGVLPLSVNVAQTDPAAFEQVIQVNLLGVFRTVHAALPHVIESRGYLQLTASVICAFASPTIASYAASKAGAESLGRSLSFELAGTGVDVGIAYFGVIETGMLDSASTADGGMSGLLAALPGRLKPVPVTGAGAAIVAGIERRSRRVYAPGYVPFALDLRTVIRWADPLIARYPGLVAAVANASRRAEVRS